MTQQTGLFGMVVECKSNEKLQICSETRPLNNALQCLHYLLPVINNTLPTFWNAKVFSLLDTKNRFWHLELDMDLSKLTTTTTVWMLKVAMSSVWCVPCSQKLTTETG